jgi:hypothetical protein
MKLRIGCLMLVILSLTLAMHAVTCTQATLKGTYAVANIGSIAGSPGYGDLLFLETYDGVSAFTGSGVENVNGTVSFGVTITGTYSVSADCAFTRTSTDSLGNTINVAGSVIQNGGEMAGLSTTTGTELQFTAYKQHKTACTNAIPGSYVFAGQGPSTPHGPQLASGQFKLTSKGTDSGSFVSNFNGKEFDGTFTGTESVNPDCTFTSTTTYSTGNTEHRFGVHGIGQGGVKSLTIVTDSGWVELTTYY